MVYTLEHLQKFKKSPCIIWKVSIGDTKIYSYQNVIDVTQNLIEHFIEFGVEKHCKILVNIGHVPALLPVILGILNFECCYCPITLNENEIPKTLKLHNARFLITDKVMSESAGSRQTVNIFNIPIHIYSFNSEILRTRHQDHTFCYAIQTSGSTGEPKIVNVPYSCILPNIVSLSEILTVTSNDVIFVSSPPTFDPSIVDIFLALKNGAAILLVPSYLRLLPEMLAKLIFRDDTFNATICQMTPSLFRRFPSHVLENLVFHRDTSLRTLILGGEPFPLPSEYKKWPVWSTSRHTRIFNIYGITEVSCWSSIEEISEMTAEPSLGKPLDSDTVLSVRDTLPPHDVMTSGTGELFIECRKRRCFINSDSADLLNHNMNAVSRSTGDLVETRSGRIYYKGRTNAMIKRFGCRVSLSSVEEKIKNAEKTIDDVCCLIESETSKLIAFVVSSKTAKEPALKNFLNGLAKVERPDAVIFIDKMPLSAHGKISKSKLLNHYISVQKRDFKSIGCVRNKAREIFIMKLNIYLGFENSIRCPAKKPRLHSYLEKSFMQVGGCSFIALRLMSEIEEIFCQNLGNVFIKLLDELCPLKDVIQELESTIAQNRTTFESGSQTERSVDQLNLTVKWKHDLEKCVDASPIVATLSDQILVAVGSHSHKLVALGESNGGPVCQLQLPDRIEGKIATIDRIGIVGCYDGFLYKFDMITGEILQKFDSKGMIKCQPLKIGNFVVFGNYSTNCNIFCLNYETFQMHWSSRIGTKSCFASPVQYDENSTVVCTLDGCIAVIRNSSGCIVWKSKLNSPIFSTPVRISPNRLVVAEVNGSVHFFQDDVVMSSYVTSASIFSSLVSLDAHSVLFGCYDNFVYCLKYLDDSKTLVLLWRLQLSAQIYSTPSILRGTHIIVCTTKGKIHIIDLEARSMVGHIQLDGEIFSSPSVFDNRIYVGCRDNFLYCISING